MENSTKKDKSILSRYGLPAVVLGGAITLGTAFGPGLASAQDAESDESVESATETETESKRGKHKAKKSNKAEVLEELGLSVEVVKAGREEDKSLAQIAEENGISESDLVNAIVSSITERFEDSDKEVPEDLESKVEERVNTIPSEKPEKNGKHGKKGTRGSSPDAESVETEETSV